MRANMSCAALVVMLGVVGEAAAMGSGHGVYVSNVRPDPDVPIHVPIQIAADTAKPAMAFEGGCTVVQTTDNQVGWEGGFYPAGAVGVHFNNVLHVELDTTKAKVSILHEPKHGKLIDTGIIGDGPYYEYRANSGYLGSDDATLLIDIDGKSYKVHTKFYVVEKVNDNNFYGTGAPATVCAESQPKRVATTDIEVRPYNSHLKCKACADASLFPGASHPRCHNRDAYQKFPPDEIWS